MAIFDPAITMAIGDTPRHIAPTRSYLSRGDASAMPLGVLGAGSWCTINMLIFVNMLLQLVYYPILFLLVSWRTNMI